MRPMIFTPQTATGTSNVAPLNLYCESFLVTCAVVLSAGAVLTYNVEVSLEPINDTAAFGGTVWTPANANWFVVPGMSGLSASNMVTIQGPCSAIRLNVTSYTSGSAQFEVNQSGGIK